MTDTLLQESTAHLEAEFYGKPFYFSYSSLSKLLWNPRIFYETYVLGLREEQPEGHLIEGRVIHALMLQKPDFDKRFHVTAAVLPTDKMKKVIDGVFSRYKHLKNHYQELGLGKELRSFSDEILEEMQAENYFQNLSTDEQRLDKVCTAQNQQYWEELLGKQGKILVSPDVHSFCRQAVKVLESSQKVRTLMGLDAVPGLGKTEVYNEQAFQLPFTTRPFGIRGVMDNLHIDHDRRVIYLNDIKSTTKDLKDFADSVEFYNYWLQAIIYITNVAVQFRHLLDAGYAFQFHFIVIDRTLQHYCFPVSDASMSAWADRMRETMDKAQWHYDNKSFSLPYAFATGSVTL